MQELSISFTLGKASMMHGANVDHANRKFIAPNVDIKRTHQNVTYVCQDVEDAYDELFGAAVAAYNAKQKQKCRRIDDYYQHISEGKREEAFYEIIVQFGDSITAPCGSEVGRIAEKMLDEYVRSFRERNPNLHMFNAVMHLDEASPHLHINFIPFYTMGRKTGLQKGVSMKQALIEQGFTPQSIRQNQLVAWEQSERFFMEGILQRHGFARDDKQAFYKHMSVDDYKATQDEKRIVEALRRMRNITQEDLTTANVRQLQMSLQAMEQKTKSLEAEKLSPYKSFYYSSPDKQAFVQAQMDVLHIPYRETENGFEAQECYVDEIRKLEKQFKTPQTSAREKLREDVDRLLMQSEHFDELLAKLQKAGYEIKEGKYIATRPRHGTNFIRLKSLGEMYSEFALRNRLKAKRQFEEKIEQQIIAGQPDDPAVIVLRTIRFYTISFGKDALPMRRKAQRKPFSWTNDAELDKLLRLNQRINEGATVETLRQELAEQNEMAAAKEAALKKEQNDLKTFLELEEQIAVVFEGKRSDVFNYEQAAAGVRRFPTIGRDNYRNIEKLIRNQTEALRNAEVEHVQAQVDLKNASELLAVAEQVMGGTFVQSLVYEERQCREVKYIPNGLKDAGRRM
ncbi:MAG: plasmid recombination protein [Oscillospiraceae bacterium]|nr:plasmid recombination protein [Oscillospiraceae bacterium]